MPKPRKPRPAPASQLAQMRALAHPLRLQLLELFAREPRTTKQAALVMGQPPTRLYHHVAALERVGLVRLKSTRPNRGTIEKHYEAATPPTRLGPAAKRAPAAAIAHAYSAPGPAARQVAHTLFAEAQAEFQAAVRRGAGERSPARPVALRAAVFATRAQIAQLQRTWLAAIAPLSAEPGAAGSARKAAQRWTLTAAIIPAPLGAPAKRPRKPRQDR